MASISDTANLLLLLIVLMTRTCLSFSATVVEDLANLQPPSDFNSTIAANCEHNPSLRYCNSSDLKEIFRFTIVASHLCNESRNPNCAESFPKIDLHARPKIAPLYLSYNFFWKFCPLTTISIDFSNLSLKGSFPTQILSCTQLESLDLSLNDLTGDVPVQNFSLLQNLTHLNLSYNRFSELKISESQFFRRFNASSFHHSGLLPSHHTYTIKAVLLLVAFPITVILLVCSFAWLCFKRPDYLPRFLRKHHKFTPAMIKAATNGLSRKHLMAKSGGVDMYRGKLRDGTQIRIEIYSDNISREKCKEFVDECKVLVQLCHNNLLQVMGWCSNRKMRAIVTEWTDGNTVETWISGSAPTWKQRLRVVMGVVEGMIYLQEQWPQVGYHLGSSSVLLTKNLEPLISRFKVKEPNSNIKNIDMFGVLLLEMITNITINSKSDEASFIDNIRTNYPENLSNVIDARMKLTETMLDQAKQGIELGLMCTTHSVAKYPSLRQISHMVTKVYHACPALPSHNEKAHHTHGGSGQNHIQSKINTSH